MPEDSLTGRPEARLRTGSRSRKARGAGHERTAEILSAARELFARQGYEAVTTRALARHVGLSQTGLYVYFKTKEEIYDAVARETFGRLTEAYDRVEAMATGPEDLLRKMLAAYVDFGLKHPDEYQLTFMTTHPALTPAHRKDLSLPIEAQGPGIRSFLHFRAAVGRLAETGLFKTDDVTLTAQTILAAIHGLVALLIARPWYPWADRQALIDQVIQLIVRGLKTSRE